MKHIKNFLLWGSISGIAAFVGCFILFGVVLLFGIYPPFNIVLGTSTGCGIGTGLINGVAAAFRLKDI